MTTFSDIFKSSFLEKVTGVSVTDMIIAMAVAFALGLFIYIVYKKTFRGVMYSSSFGVSLMAMTLITTLIILAITSNIILSLGMVGALSIVRFRTAVKEPLDIAFLFWAISAGIVTGAGLIPLAVIGSVFIGVVLVIFVNAKTADTPYIAIISCTDDTAEKAAMELLKKHTKKQLVKSKTVTNTGIELMVEIKLNGESTEVCNALSATNGVTKAALVSYNGEYLGS
ncbi:MAG: DUF4956 domain-containing protein [Ruminococcus sp.]|nr:DUF4956 domain-containing protein [Ruminococcus sp.]MCM1380694.1 DUF4956 domain-containing protein [Muribaculaceae bacterium]MCM1480769.1 DUF4956 domain-containing protein [Muribaculaceae bacterium]